MLSHGMCGTLTAFPLCSMFARAAGLVTATRDDGLCPECRLNIEKLQVLHERYAPGASLQARAHSTPT